MQIPLIIQTHMTLSWWQVDTYLAGQLIGNFQTSVRPSVRPSVRQRQRQFFNFKLSRVHTQFEDSSIGDSVTRSVTDILILEQTEILDTCDLWEICFKWWENMTWQTKRQRHVQLENTFKERSVRLVTFETFAQSDQKTKGQRQRQWQIH